MHSKNNASKLIAIFALGALILPKTAHADSHGNKFVHSRPFNGQIYVMYSDHMSLYTYDEDQAGKSNCYDECAETWIPALLDAGTALGESYTLMSLGS